VELALLAHASRATGASRSELIRRAVRKAYGRSDGAARVAALQRGVGIWRDRSFSGAEYVDRTRGDLNERLSRMGLE
jgi:Arc/MetJ-type ribon-helix-helix transcriptional regulator